MNKNTILTIIPFAFHRESGSSLSAYYRVLALSELFEKVHIVTTPHGKELNIDNIIIFRNPKKTLFATYEPGAYKKRIVYEFFLMFKTIWLLFNNKYLCVIVHGSSIYWAFILNKLFRIPFIAMVHGNIYFELEKWKISSSRFLKKIASKLENSIINSFNLIIAEHDSVKKILTDAGISANKIEVIRICVKSLPAIKRDFEKNLFTVLYTGTFVKVQNIELLYKTAVLLKGQAIQIIIIGANENELKIERNNIENYGVQDIVHVLPRVNQSELFAYYKNADVVVSPREFGHDTPMKIFDYMNFGKCILATDRAIHTGILNKEIACLVEPTPEAFAAKIIELINNLKEIYEKELAAKKYFEENFELKQMIKEYGTIVNTLSNV